MGYLSEMTEEQTLVIYSGHPLGLFPSHPAAPRVVVTNGMVIPNYSTGEDYERMNAFYDGKYDVLLATTIVESGLDIPRANRANSSGWVA